MHNFTDRFAGRGRPDPFAIAAAGAGVAIAGMGYAFWRRRQKTRAEFEPIASDAPHGTLDKPSARALFGKSVLVNRPREDVFEAWKVERFPEFMENVIAVEPLGGGTARWTIKGLPR